MSDQSRADIRAEEVVMAEEMRLAKKSQEEHSNALYDYMRRLNPEEVRDTTSPDEVRSGTATLVLAANRRVDRVCIHFATADNTYGTFITNLTARSTACPRCLLVAYDELTRSDPDDLNCDICDRPAPGGAFQKIMAGVGMHMFVANVGDCCIGVFEALGVKGG